MAQQEANPRGTEGNRGTENLPSNAVGNPGTLLGMETVKGTPMARFRAEPGTWVSASMKSLGYDRIYGRDEAYGAYRGVAKSPSGQPLSKPDRLTPGQEYLIPVPGVAARTEPARTDPKTDYAGSGGSRLGVDRPEAGSAQVAGAAGAAALLGGAALKLNPSVDPLLNLLAKPPAGLRLVPEPPSAFDPAPNLLARPPAGLRLAPELAMFGPPGLALLALIFTGWSLFRQRNQYEERVRERGLTWREPPPEPPPPSRKETPSAKIGPPPVVAEKARRAWQNGIINYDEYLLALNTGVLILDPGVDPGPGQPELVAKLMARLAEAKANKNEKAYQAVIDELLKLNNGLTHIAVHIKRRGQMSGATVEVAVAQRASGKFLIAGLNSSADWTPKQLKELELLGIHVAPQQKWLPESQVEGKAQNQPHAEENMLWEIAILRAKAIRFSNAPVGAGKPHSDVCRVCRAKIRDARASIEPGMHESTVAPAPASGQKLRAWGQKLWAWDASTGTWTNVDPGDGWAVTATGKVLVWDKSTDTWTNVGTMHDPEGTPGATGLDPVGRPRQW
jgi:hypothetical protein